MENQNELSLQEMQEANLSALIEIDRICRENDLTYFLAYGTLLGAVRHKGYIPWDDDVDIIMPRKDFEAFQALTDKTDSCFRLCNRANTQNYPYYLPRFCNMDYQYVTTVQGPKFDIGAFVDIYILDNACSDEKAGKDLNRKMNRMNAMYLLYLSGQIGGSGLKRMCAVVLHRLLRMVKGKDYPQRINRDMERELKKRTSEQDRYVGIPCWSFGFLQYEKSVFSEKTEMVFEDRLFYVPKQYEMLLTLWYKDYMALPPENKRVASHSYKMYRRERAE